MEVPATDARLVVAADRRDDEDTRSVVEFTCPECGSLGSVRVDERAARLVAGTDVALVAPPAAPPSRRRVGGVTDGR